MLQAESILRYWLGPYDINPDNWQRQTKRWYAPDLLIDNEIRERFGLALEAAENGAHDDWQRSTTGCLALIILFDQFSRNLFRGSPDAYRNDKRAVGLSDEVITSGVLPKLTVPAQLMVFHPYHHAEDLDRQERVVRLAKQLLATAAPEWHWAIKSNLAFLESHAAIIRQFGRFPHRNAILGRLSTEQEIAHLRKDSRTFGQ